MTIEDQLRQAIASHAAEVPEPADRWDEIAAAAAATRRRDARQRSRRRTGGIAGLVLAAAAAAAVIALPALTREPSRQVVVTPGHPPTTRTPNPTPVPARTSTSAVPGAGFHYQPLYPFRTLQEAAAWEVGFQVSGVEPWHRDPGMTALSFAGWLGYTDVTTVFGVRTDSSGAHVTVGFPNPNGNPVASAVVHLRRFGTAVDAPWEVVGTDDTPDFSMSTPKYGGVVKSPLTVGGAIMGVDENIKVEVRQLSSPALVGSFCCQAAGNTGAPWRATVAFHGATDQVLTVAASTGGHLAAVERFTVTGVRTSSGATPGL